MSSTGPLGAGTSAESRLAHHSTESLGRKVFGGVGRSEELGLLKSMPPENLGKEL